MDHRARCRDGDCRIPGDGTLHTGTYNVLGTMRLVGANITTNEATIILDGASSNLYSTACPTNTDALAGFATNAAAGSFTIKNGRNFSRSAAQPFENNGLIVIGTRRAVRAR